MSIYIHIHIYTYNIYTYTQTDTSNAVVYLIVIALPSLNFQPRIPIHGTKHLNTYRYVLYKYYVSEVPYSQVHTGMCYINIMFQRSLILNTLYISLLSRSRVDYKL